VKKLVILSSRFPYPLEKGDKLRLYHQIKHLSDHFDIYLLCTIESDILQGVAREVTKYCKGFKYYKISRSSQALGLALNIIGRSPFQVRYFYEKKIRKQIEQEIAEIKPDVIYCQLIRMVPYTYKLDYPMVIDFMDAFSLIMKRQHGSAKSLMRKWFYKTEAKRLSRYEKKIQDRFKVKTIISQQDKDALNEISNLQVISNGVDTEYFKGRDLPKNYDILFAGNMGYKPNVAAAKYLVNEIVGEQQYKVLIAGARPIHEVAQLASDKVTVSGWMDDIREAYGVSRIFVAPLFEGAGQQNKILQAMAIGIPCITTSQVNNAIGAKEGEEIMIADDAPTYKAHIKLLLENPESVSKIASNARILVESRYSWEKQNDKLVGLINSVT